MSSRKQTIVLFCLYCALMLWMLLLRSPRMPELSFDAYCERFLNLTPFDTIHRFTPFLIHTINPYRRVSAWINLAGNIVMFIPLGFFPPLIWKGMRGFLRTLLAGLTIMTIIEISQLLLRVGTCDIDDLILNGIGIALGYLFYAIGAGIRFLIRKYRGG